MEASEVAVALERAATSEANLAQNSQDSGLCTRVTATQADQEESKERFPDSMNLSMVGQAQLATSSRELSPARHLKLQDNGHRTPKFKAG